MEVGEGRRDSEGTEVSGMSRLETEGRRKGSARVGERRERKKGDALAKERFCGNDRNIRLFGQMLFSDFREQKVILRTNLPKQGLCQPFNFSYLLLVLLLLFLLWNPLLVVVKFIQLSIF